MKRTVLVLTLTLLLSGAAPAQATVFEYGNDNPSQPLTTDELGNVGGSQAQLNLQSSTISFIISLSALLY
jgi:microcystin-dependent protein